MKIFFIFHDHLYNLINHTIVIFIILHLKAHLLKLIIFDHHIHNLIINFIIVIHFIIFILIFYRLI